MSLYTFKWKLYLNDEKKTVDPPLFYDILRGLKALCDSLWKCCSYYHTQSSFSSKQTWNFGFKDLQSPWMLIVTNELIILMIKKTHLEKRNMQKLVKSHQPPTINIYIKFFFLTWVNVWMKILSNSKFERGLANLEYLTL